MPDQVAAFNRGFLVYHERQAELGFSNTPGDRHLMAVIIARVMQSSTDGKQITANKLTLDADAMGLSPRTAIRLSRQLVKLGLFSELIDGARKSLHPTEALTVLWSRNVAVFHEELTRSGYIQNTTK